MPGADSRGHESSYGGGAPPPSGYGHHDSGYGAGGYSGGGGGYGGGSGYGGDHGGQGQYGGYGSEQRGDSYEPEKEKKSSNKSGMLLGVAGGLAVGAVGGALLNEALGKFTWSLGDLSSPINVQ